MLEFEDRIKIQDLIKDSIDESGYLKRGLEQFISEPKEHQYFIEDILREALKNNSLDVIKIALKYSIKPLKEIAYKTIIFYAKSPVAMELLLNNDFQLNTLNEQGRTVLTNALRENYSLDLIEYILKNGVNTNEKDVSGYFPIHCCFFPNSTYKIDKLKLLVTFGANINEIDTERLGNPTALDYAKAIGDDQLVEYIQLNGGIGNMSPMKIQLAKLALKVFASN